VRFGSGMVKKRRPGRVERRAFDDRDVVVVV
jgi:hypothetical protein